MPPLNLPNALTVARIGLVPVLVVVLLQALPGGSLIAAALFVGAALTDGLDGYIARARKDETDFGRVMDPIADKLLIAAALIVLVSADRLELWVAVVIIGREFAVTGLRMVAGQRGKVISASSLGKAKTAVQVATITALIAVSDATSLWLDLLVYVMVAVTVISGLDYFLGLRRGAGEASQKRPAEPSGERAISPPQAP